MLGLLRAVFRAVRQKKLRAELYKELDIGEGTRVGLANLDGMFPKLIRIGKNCIFAPKSMVLTHDASYYLFTGKYRVAPVTIGDNCFVGYGAIIMPGVEIGSNVVIGAGSVVTHDVPSDSVVAGGPAKVISSLSDYLNNCKNEQIFAAPYAGKQPSCIDSNDVAAFRKLIYSKFKKE